MTTKKIEAAGATADAGKSDSTKTKLPNGVTLKPRNDEEMDMGLISKWPDAMKVYLKVSDDAGEDLGNKVLERQIKRFNKEYGNPKVKIKNPNKVLTKAIKLATRYTLQINKAETGFIGTIVKYRIRGGGLFLIIKELVKATDGPKWTEWFKSNFDPREFRSVQDYMRLAKIPGIIRYAVFGKERLLQIIRQLIEEDWKERLNGNGEKEVDPVAAFIERNDIHFKPTEEVDAQELRIEADIAINHQKLAAAGITEINKKMVDALVRDGKEVEPAHVRELKVAKEAGWTKPRIVRRFKELVASDCKAEPLMTPDRKAEGFKKTTDRFIKAMESAIADAEYLGQVDVETVNSLKEMLQQLEQMIQPTE